MPRRGVPRRIRVRNAALFVVLLIAAVGLLYRMLRPYFAIPPPAAKIDEPVSAEAEVVALLRVIDGDTIEVRWRGGPERVRLLRIDTPERKERGYDEATRALERLVRRGDLELEFERPGQPERDKYDRLLAYVRADGLNTSIEMVRLGYSRFWTEYGEGRFAEDLTAAEREARSDNAGLWSPSGWNRD
jgi:micrococcal nuclease